MDVLSADQQQSDLRFQLPEPFMRLARLDLVKFEPWGLFNPEEMLGRYRDMSLRYPGRFYVPFAARQDMDEVACWAGLSTGQQVLVVHDFASPGWEVRRTYGGFYAWLRSVFDDFVDFDF